MPQFRLFGASTRHWLVPIILLATGLLGTVVLVCWRRAVTDPKPEYADWPPPEQHDPSRAPQAKVGSKYFLSPTGNDEGPGSRVDPWKTLEFATSRLAPGDTLLLTEGDYHETGFTLTCRGTPEAPITIMPEPGARVRWVLGPGGHEAFLSGRGDPWALHDAGKQIYVSRDRVEGVAGAWLVDHDFNLPEYAHERQFFSSGGKDAVYVGPGSFRKGGRVYIRLTPNPNERDAGGRPSPHPITETNPNRHPILLLGDEAVEIRAEHLVFEGLNVYGANWLALDIQGESHHVTFRSCRFRFPNYGILGREGARNIEVVGCHISNGFGPWFRWGDIKCDRGKYPPPMSHYNTYVVSGHFADSVFRDNVWERNFICMENGHAARNNRIHRNLFLASRGDAISFSPHADNIRIDHNLIVGCFEGVSQYGGENDPRPGQVYVHNNVIDAEPLCPVDRPDLPSDWHYHGRAWGEGMVFSSHEWNEENDRSRVHVYNNTFVARNGEGLNHLAKDVPGHSYLNNIFYVFGKADLSPYPRPRRGGNVLWGTARVAKGGLDEPRGLMADPALDLDRIRDRNDRRDPIRFEELWERYRPRNTAMNAPGEPYTGLGWPGTESFDYRGALRAAEPARVR